VDIKARELYKLERLYCKSPGAVQGKARYEQKTGLAVILRRSNATEGMGS